MRKIKVADIITRMTVGGAQKVTASVVTLLDKKRFDTTLVSGPQDFYKEISDEWNIEVAVIPDLIREISPVKDFIALARLYIYLKRNKFDIVHTHTSKAGILGRIAAKLAGVPVIVHSTHGSIYHPIYYGRAAIFFLSRLENFVASFTDRIITCSHNEKDDYLEHRIGTDDKYTVIYNGLKEEMFLRSYDGASKRRELGVPDGAILIGNIARLAPEKGHIYCLEAFKPVAEKFPQAILLAVGDGPLKADIEKR